MTLLLCDPQGDDCTRALGDRRWLSRRAQRIFAAAAGLLVVLAVVALLWPREGTQVRIWQVGEPVSSVAFAPDGRSLAVGLTSGCVQLIETSRGTLMNTFLPDTVGHSGEIASLAFSPDGQVLASGSDDATVRLWRINNGALLQTLGAHKYRVGALAFSPDGRLLASGSNDSTVRLWQADDWQQASVVAGGRPSDLEAPLVVNIAFADSGRSILVGYSNFAALKVQVPDGKIVQQGTKSLRDDLSNAVAAMAFSSDGQTVVTAPFGNEAFVWKLTDTGYSVMLGSQKGFLRTWQGHSDFI